VFLFERFELILKNPSCLSGSDANNALTAAPVGGDQGRKQLSGWKKVLMHEGKEFCSENFS